MRVTIRKTVSRHECYDLHITTCN